MRSQPGSNTSHLQLHFIIVEVTQNILIYEFDVLHIFDIKIVFLYDICEFIWVWFDITHYACLTLLIQLRAAKIDIVLFL